MNLLKSHGCGTSGYRHRQDAIRRTLTDHPIRTVDPYSVRLNHFTSGIETMVRDAELQEMEKKWREDNEHIMREHPPGDHYPEPGSAASGEPDAMPPAAGAEPDDSQLPPHERPLP